MRVLHLYIHYLEDIALQNSKYTSIPKKNWLASRDIYWIITVPSVNSLHIYCTELLNPTVFHWTPYIATGLHWITMYFHTDLYCTPLYGVLTSIVSLCSPLYTVLYHFYTHRLAFDCIMNCLYYKLFLNDSINLTLTDSKGTFKIMIFFFKKLHSEPPRMHRKHISITSWSLIYRFNFWNHCFNFIELLLLQIVSLFCRFDAIVKTKLFKTAFQ